MLTHHAYYIEGPLSLYEAYADTIRKSEGFGANDPNFVVRQYEKFGIDEARTLIELSSLKNTGERALFFVATPSMTSEAQQALLKLLEEPQQGTIFVLLVPLGTLIPTLRSRTLRYPEELKAKGGGRDAEEFLASPYKKRSELVASMLKDEDGVRERVRGFFDALEAELYPHLGTNKEVRESLGELQHFRQYLTDRSPSLKMILEHFAATLPTF